MTVSKLQSLFGPGVISVLSATAPSGCAVSDDPAVCRATTAANTRAA